MRWLIMEVERLEKRADTMRKHRDRKYARSSHHIATHRYPMTRLRPYDTAKTEFNVTDLEFVRCTLTLGLEILASVPRLVRVRCFSFSRCWTCTKST